MTEYRISVFIESDESEESVLRDVEAALNGMYAVSYETIGIDVS